MGRVEIRIAGEGGQGVVKAGIILAKAAVYAGLNVAQMQSYGPEVRGGNCISDVVISEDEIDYPGVTAIDVLVSMSQKAYEANIRYVKPGGIVIVDSKVNPSLFPAVNTYVLPLTKIAQEVGGKINSAALGALAAILDLPKKYVIKAMKEEIPNLEGNLKAFERGYSEACKLVGKVSLQVA